MIYDAKNPKLHTNKLLEHSDAHRVDFYNSYWAEPAWLIVVLASLLDY